MTLCYLNGEFLPLAEARISPMDRGFLFGDGVYEVIPVYSRRPFRLDEHLGRLQNSLDDIRLANPLGRDEWHKLVERLVRESEWSSCSVLLQVMMFVPAALAVHVMAVPTGSVSLTYMLKLYATSVTPWLGIYP